MKSAECQARADRAEARRVDAVKRQAVYAATFGSSSLLAQGAADEVMSMALARNKWIELRDLHYKTRLSLLAKKEVPAFCFGF